MKHIIMTRMALGMLIPSAARRRAEFLVTTLLPSLAAQTSHDFIWVAVTDEAIDRDVEAFVRDAIAPHPHFHLEKTNTFKTKDLFFDPVVMCEKYLGTGRDVLVTQIDDDDALAVHFVEAMQLEARKCVGLTAITFRNGIFLHPVSGLVLDMDVESPSVGLTMLTPDAAKWNPVRGGHIRAHARVVRHGGQSLRIATTDPYWMQVIYSFSASREIRPAEVVDAGFPLRGVPTTLEKLRHFNLDLDLSDRLMSIIERYPEERASIAGAGLKRMAVKRHLLDLSARAETELRQARGNADAKAVKNLKGQIRALRSAYYAF